MEADKIESEGNYAVFLHSTLYTDCAHTVSTLCTAVYTII